MKPHFAIAFASTLALAACAAPVPAPTPAPGVGDDAFAASCDADAATSAVGKAASAQVLEEARIAAGAQVARILKPGQVVTMEYHASRLNLHVDEHGIVVRVLCG